MTTGINPRGGRETEHGEKLDVPLHSSELLMIDGATNSHPVGSNLPLRKLLKLFCFKSVLDDMKNPSELRTYSSVPLN